MATQDEINKLEEEIAAKQILLTRLKRTPRSEVLKDLSEYTDEEKIRFSMRLITPH